MSRVGWGIVSLAGLCAWALGAVAAGCGGATTTSTAHDAGFEAGADAGLDVQVPDVVSGEPAAPETGPGTGPTMDASVEASMPTPAPPPDYAWYVLDETSGTTAHDSTAHHFDVTNLTGVTWGSGASFDGIGGGATTTVDQGFRTPPITMTAWLRPLARTDGSFAEGALQPFPPNVLSGDVPGVGGYGLGLNVWTDGSGGSALAAEGVDTCTQAGLCVCNQDMGDAGPPCTMPQACSAGFAAGTEYFVAVTITAPSGGSMQPAARVYVDGQLWDVTTAYVPPMASPVPLSLGVHNSDPSYGTHRFYAGRMRDVRIYTRDLGAAEVAQLFAEGPATQAPPQGDP